MIDQTTYPNVPADFGPRFLGFLIDGTLMGLVGDILGGLHMSAFEPLVITLYFVYFFSTSGQTLGMTAMHIKVVRTDGQSLTWTTGILRYVGYILSLPLFLGFIWVLFDPQKQGWHDKIASTVVIRAA